MKTERCFAFAPLPRRIARCALTLVLSIAWGASTVAGQDEESAPPRWTSLFAFGDSYSDSGAGYVDGDGPTAIAYAARELGLDFTHAADSDFRGRSLNFAVSGAQTGKGEGRRVRDALLGWGMQNQVDDFVARVRAGSITFDPERTLFFLAGGLNDKPLETATTVENLTRLVERLHAAGGRHFSIAVLPTAIPSFSEVARRLNPALAALAKRLRDELALIDVRTSRWGEYFDAIMAEPQKYGIMNTSDACAGRAIFDQDTTPRGDPSTYFFYHSNHPSTAVHRHVGTMLAAEFMKAASVQR